MSSPKPLTKDCRSSICPSCLLRARSASSSASLACAPSACLAARDAWRPFATLSALSSSCTSAVARAFSPTNSRSASISPRSSATFFSRSSSLPPEPFWKLSPDPGLVEHEQGHDPSVLALHVPAPTRLPRGSSASSGAIALPLAKLLPELARRPRGDTGIALGYLSHRRSAC